MHNIVKEYAIKITKKWWMKILTKKDEGFIKVVKKLVNQSINSPKQIIILN